MAEKEENEEKWICITSALTDRSNQLLDIALATKMRHFKTKQKLLDYCIKETLKEFEKFIEE